MRVAVLDDESTHLELIRQTVTALGHDCHGFTDGKACLRALRHETFDLLILDGQVPDISGLEVLRWVRENLSERMPALLVASRNAEADVIEGFSVGADDVMVKPIRAGELTARVKALLRRAYPPPPNAVSFGRYRFDLAGVQVTVDGKPVALKQREFELALFLFQNIGRLLSRQYLLEAVWAVDAPVLSRSLDTHVSRLRSKLGLNPQNGYRLAAIYNVGYRLEATRAECAPANQAPAIAAA